MGIHKRVLIILFTILFILIGFEMLKTRMNKEIEYPLQKDGYPKDNIVIINGKEYSLNNIELANSDATINHEIMIKFDDKKNTMLDILLPERICINRWSIEEGNENIDLILYQKIKLPIQNNMKEGNSSVVQRFKIVVPNEQKTKVSFKWANVNEQGKSFKDKKEDYFLKINLTN